MLPRYFCWDIGRLPVLPLFRRFIAICTFSLYFLAAHAQSPLIDSLIIELKTEITSDSTRVDMLNELAEAYIDHDVNKIPEYAKEALQLAEDIGYLHGQALALGILGFYSQEKRDLDLANRYYEQSLELAEQIGDSEVLFHVLGSKGIMLLEKAAYLEALAYFHRAVDIGKAAEMDDVADVLSTIAWVHGTNGDKEKQEQYIKECIAWAAQATDPDVKIHGLQQSGYLAWKKKDYKNAIEYYNQALEIALEHNLRWRQERIYYSTSAVHGDLGDYEKAIEVGNQSVQLCRELNDNVSLSRSLLGLAELYVDAKEYDAAINVSEEGMELSRKLDIPDLSSRYMHVLMSAYRGKDDFQNAFSWQESHHALEDSIHNKEMSGALAEMESTYQLEKKTIENDLLLARQEEQVATINQQKILTLAGGVVLLLLIVLGVILFKAYRTNIESSKILEEKVEKRTQELRATNEALAKSNKSLEHFAQSTSYDMKEPLRNICSFAGLLRHELRPEKNSKGDEYLGLLIDGTKQLQRLVDDILDFSKFSQEEKVKTMPVDLHQVMGEIKYALSLNFDLEDVTLTWDKNLPTLEGQHAKFLMLFKNLVENGIKFNDSDHPTVNVDYASIEEYDIISVTDNGIGIETAYRKDIFGMFTRLHHRGIYKGSGLGLALCKNIAESLGGRIEVESKVGKGSTFKVYLKKTTSKLGKRLQYIGYD